jgi:RNA polymerase sigma factor (sigma-70 family)
MSGVSVTISPTTSTTDLVDEARRGISGAIEQLVDRYARLVWATVGAFRLRDADAHDAVQNTWLRLIERMHTINDAERLPGWLATTARRECLKIIRSGRREVVGLESSVLDRPDDVSPDPEDVATQRAMSALLWQRVADLPAAGRHLLVTLTAPDAPSYRDFSKKTGMPIGAIGPTRMRYLRRLRRDLELRGLGKQAWY